MLDIDTLDHSRLQLVPPLAPILVTGGAGFLGSHLCDELVGRGRSVICLDNLLTGQKANIAHLLDHPGFRFIDHDVIDPIALEVSAIYNLACPASPPHYQRDPVHTLKTSVFGAINLLDIARANDAPIFHASTSEIYGDPDVHPQPETYWGHTNSWGPRACYDEGKRCAETLFFDHVRQYGIDARLARIFNTYGPRMAIEDGRVVSNFIVQALTNGEITIYGDGTQTRSFCYVSDLIDGFLKLMALPQAPETPINLGNPVEFTMIELAHRIIALTGSRARIVHRPLPEDDPTQRRPVIERARALLDWEPTIGLSEGLQRTIAYFDALLGERSHAAGRAAV
ncbi:UDP-glucuronic acid decarboxylase family protein [Fulvimarina sp. 2208YS6-2-32]|uniref:UDP-glucuronic acid decarboxylase family protein n=1 Tax=Fulvimarina uroteuthidis TaxID=3098149 RepID=A0ABU5I206_9HYPH|nr:UDP-glucuronic acid decarboxylase family protein [Fulvimarina sp. 2208YS6-2-32]MDY8108803.1 UDP-glucuronic acid decarboxylase family protein [Fulvimarina sp. 2208YS6-2-32]